MWRKNNLQAENVLLQNQEVAFSGHVVFPLKVKLNKLIKLSNISNNRSIHAPLSDYQSMYSHYLT